MCQLFGISSNKPVNINFSFQGWKHRGRSNPDGYGFAWWEDEVPKVAKDPSSLHTKAVKAGEDIGSVRSSTFLCHVRLASKGVKEIKNTHPFMAEKDGTNWIFAHNGTLHNFKSLALKDSSPTGATDSEHAFLWLLENLPSRDDGSFSAVLKDLAAEIAYLGRFNFLLSDGAALWAHCSDNLHYISRKPPYGGKLVELTDEGYSVGLDEVKDPDERAVIICTEPLTYEAGWERMKPGEMVVVVSGSVRVI